MIRVLLVDDQALVRAGLHVILDSDPAIEVVGEAGDGRAAISRVATLAPDVVVMDIRMPSLDGIAATRALLASGAECRVLILTTFGLEDYVYAALRAGASGFLLKTAAPDRLCEAVHTAARGEELLGPETTRLLIRSYLTRARPPSATSIRGLSDLTPREYEVLLEVAHGRSNAEVGQCLRVGEGTVKTHVARILTKLGARDRVQLVVLAHEAGLVGPETQRLEHDA